MDNKIYDIKKIVQKIRDNKEDKRNLDNKIKDTFSHNKELSYLGLEGPNFGSYIYFSQKCNIIPKKTAIIEKDSKAYSAMRCIVKNHKKIKGGRIFDGISLHKECLEKFVDQPSSYGANIINLDYNGPLDPNKVGTLYNLFAKGYVADESVIFITLNEHPRRTIQSSGALKAAFKTDDPAVITNYCIKAAASEYKFRVENTSEKRYVDKETPLLIMSFKLKK